MENSTLRDCLSYDSTLNYFLWSSNVDSLKILVSEILKNTAIASAEVNEDKHHKMLSFKAADCTIKLYTTTKKIIIQGSGSASLTKAFSDFLNVKDNGDEAMNSNNGGQQSEASAADEHIETYAIEQLDPTDALTTTSQDEVKSDLQLTKEEIKMMKNDISYILNNGGKINISSAGAAETENLNFKLQEENNLLRNQLKVAKDNLAELKEVIGTLESEKSTLISTIRILQRNDLKLSQDEAYNLTAVGTITEAVTPLEAVTQTSIPVVRPAKKTNQNGKKNQSQKKNQKGSGNRKDKKKEQEHGPQNTLLESSNSRPGTSFNRQSDQQDSENRVVILGDSTVKGLQWWKMSKNNTKVQMRCFPGATVSDMESYAIPTVRTDPSEIILHVGTNDLRNRSPREVAEDIINLCEDISQNTTASVTISGLTHRTDEPSLGDKVRI